jgi:hypothetical protein
MWKSRYRPAGHAHPKPKPGPNQPSPQTRTLSHQKLGGSRLSGLISMLLGKRTRQYVEMEAAGLKKAAEAMESGTE